ncbi:hypothetical protein C3L33_13615, partial [Rhododendron williamsianum]
MLEQAEETPKALDLNKRVCVTCGDITFVALFKLRAWKSCNLVRILKWQKDVSGLMQFVRPLWLCQKIWRWGNIHWKLEETCQEVIPKLEEKLSEAVGRVCNVQPKAKMYLQFESSKLSTTWGYLSAIGLCVTTFRMISLMSGFFLKPDAMFDEYVYDAVPLFGGFLSISGVSELCTPPALVCLIFVKEKVRNGKKANRKGITEESLYHDLVKYLLMDEGLYEYAKIIFAFISNWAKLASTLVKLKQFQGAVDAARKANSSKTWKEVCFAFVDVEEFRLAQICGLNIIIQYDEFDNAATTIINQSPEAWDHMQFKDVAVKVAYFELYHKAVHFYLEEHPDLINVICLTCLHFALISQTYVALFEQIEKHELLEMKRVAAYIYKKAGMNLDADSLVTVAACVEAPLLLSSCIALAPKLYFSTL